MRSACVRRRRSRSGGSSGAQGGALGAALGIAAAAAVLAGILVGATVAKDRSVAQDVERLPAASRAVRASWFGVPAGRDEAWRVLDRQARAALAPLPAGEPVPIVLVREATLGGAFVGLAAVDGLAPARPAPLGTPAAARARPSGARCCGCAARGGCPTFPACASCRWVRRRSAPASSSATSSHRPTTRSRTPSSPRRSPAPTATTAPRRGRSSSPRASPGSSRRPCSPARTAATAGSSASRAGRRGSVEIDPLVADADRARAELQARSAAWSLSVPTQELRAAEQDATVSGTTPAARGRRGGRAARRVRRPRGGRAPARPRLGPRRLTWHGARALAARPSHRRRRASRSASAARPWAG